MYTWCCEYYAVIAITIISPEANLRYFVILSIFYFINGRKILNKRAGQSFEHLFA